MLSLSGRSLPRVAVAAVLILIAGACGTSVSDTEPRVILADDFSDPSGDWSQGDLEGGSLAYAAGGYLVTVGPEGWIRAGVAPPLASDVAIEVEVTDVQANEQVGYGVVCRVNETFSSFYFLELIDSYDRGYYRIGKMVDNRYSEIVGWSGRDPSISDTTEADATQTEAEVLHVRAECVGSTLRLFIDGSLLVEASDTELTSGQMGLAGEAFNEAEIQGRFDNFVAL